MEIIIQFKAFAAIFFVFHLIFDIVCMIKFYTRATNFVGIIFVELWHFSIIFPLSLDTLLSCFFFFSFRNNYVQCLVTWKRHRLI